MLTVTSIGHTEGSSAVVGVKFSYVPFSRCAFAFLKSESTTKEILQKYFEDSGATDVEVEPVSPNDAVKELAHLKERCDLSGFALNSFGKIDLDEFTKPEVPPAKAVNLPGAVKEEAPLVPHVPLPVANNKTNDYLVDRLQKLENLNSELETTISNMKAAEKKRLEDEEAAKKVRQEEKELACKKRTEAEESVQNKRKRYADGVEGADEEVNLF
jgi:hypothetical protein